MNWLPFGPSHVVEAHLDFEDPVKCDRMRIGQLLSNLLGNALMHGSEDGPIRVNASIDNAVFELWVSNTGEPIPPEVIGAIIPAVLPA